MGSPVCSRCPEPLGVVRNPSLVSTTVRHRGWTTEIWDVDVRRVDKNTFANAALDWMEREHHEVAFQLCGEIKRLWENG